MHIGNYLLQLKALHNTPSTQPERQAILNNIDQALATMRSQLLTLDAQIESDPTIDPWLIAERDTLANNIINAEMELKTILK